MKDIKFNKLFSNSLLFAAMTIIFASLFLEKSIILNLTDTLFITVLILIFLFLIILKERYFNSIILFYDSILISSLFVFNLKTTLLIVVIGLIIYSFISSFYNKKILNLQTDSVMIEGFIIIISLFLTQGAAIIFTSIIKDTPLLLVQVILLNLFYHLFYYILSSLEFLVTARKLKRLIFLDSLNLILINFIYTTTISYLALTLYTLLGYLPLLVLLVLNTLVAFFFINHRKEKNEKECISSLQAAVKTSLQVNLNIFQKLYSYIEAINKILPSSILGIYFIFDNHKSILPICYKCEENVQLNDISINMDNISSFMLLIESGAPITMEGNKINFYFNFIDKLSMGDSAFVIVPIILNTKIIGFTLLHPKYLSFEKCSIDLLIEAHSCMSLLIEQNLKIINNYSSLLPDYDSMYKCLDNYINNKIPFTISKIYINSNNINLDFKNSSIQKDLINTFDKLDKILFYNRDTLFIIHSLEDSLNVLEIIKNLETIAKVKLGSKFNSNDISYITIEYPADANTIFELSSKLN